MELSYVHMCGLIPTQLGEEESLPFSDQMGLVPFAQMDAG